MISASHARKIAPERGLDPNSFALREQCELATLMIAEAAREGKTSTEFFVQPLVTANNPFHVISALIRRFQKLGYGVECLSPVLLRFDWSKASVDEAMTDEAIDFAVGPALPSPATPALPPFPAPQAAPMATQTVRQAVSMLPPMPVAPPPTYIPPPRAVQIVTAPAAVPPRPVPSSELLPKATTPAAATATRSSDVARPRAPGPASAATGSTTPGSARKKRGPRVGFTI